MNNFIILCVFVAAALAAPTSNTESSTSVAHEYPTPTTDGYEETELFLKRHRDGFVKPLPTIAPTTKTTTTAKPTTTEGYEEVELFLRRRFEDYVKRA